MKKKLTININSNFNNNNKTIQSNQNNKITQNQFIPFQTINVINNNNINNNNSLNYLSENQNNPNKKQKISEKSEEIEKNEKIILVNITNNQVLKPSIPITKNISIQPKKIITFEDLSDKLILEIFIHLDQETFLQIAMVCKRWNQIVEDNID